jgi:hypothetical protein
MFDNFYATNKGNEYMAKSLTGKTLEITRGAFGSGELPEGQNITSLTDLVNELGPLIIYKKSATSNTLTVTTEFSNKVDGIILTPFNLMEIGLYGKMKNEDGTYDSECPETLIFYANALSTTKADYIPGTLTEFIINFPLVVSSSQSITVTLSESLAYPTMAEFNSRVAYLATSGGTGAALTATLEDVTLTDGMMLHLKLSEDIQSDATLSINGGTAIPIYTMDGEAITVGAVAGSYLPLTYNAEAQAWYLTGGGSGTKIVICTRDDAPPVSERTEGTMYYIIEATEQTEASTRLAMGPNLAAKID